MHSTNYTATLILVATDCPVAAATVPSKPGTVAALQHELLASAPYAMTSDDLLLAVQARRRGVVPDEDLRAALFAKPQACLRASPLVKLHGWGLHHDNAGRVALVAMESAEYARLAADPAVAKRPGMRSAR